MSDIGWLSLSRMRLFGVLFVVGIFALAAAPGPAFGLVLHDDGDAPASRPDDAVVGRWLTNASAVAIGRSGWAWTNYILTTRHQGASSGSVWFGGEEYTFTAGDITNHPSADLRVVRIHATGGEQANLTSFTPWYTNTDEATQNFVVGGFGRKRGAELRTFEDKLYGYAWTDSNNQTQRWGANRVDGIGVGGGTYTSDVLVADFDGPASGDAILAAWDSGGGWFLEQGGQWYVAGLSRAVQTHSGNPNQSWFADDFLGLPDPDYFDGVRVSSYATWLDGVLSATLAGDFDTDGDVDAVDIDLLFGNLGNSAYDLDGDNDADSSDVDYLIRTILGTEYGDADLSGAVDFDDFVSIQLGWGVGGRGWADGSFDGDGDTNFDDFLSLQLYWTTGAGGAPVPEPASALVLCAGAAAAAGLRRRRSRESRSARRRSG